MKVGYKDMEKEVKFNYSNISPLYNKIIRNRLFLVYVFSYCRCV